MNGSVANSENKKYHFDFLYKAIDDAQSITRQLDSKAAVSLVPVGFILNKLITAYLEVPKGCVSLTCWKLDLIAICAFSTLVASFLAFRVLFPLVDPVDHVHAVPGLQPAFFLGKLEPLHWRAWFSGKSRNSMLSNKHSEYLLALSVADEERIKSVLIGELLKVSFIRNLKMYRLKALGHTLVFATCLFFLLLIFSHA